MISTSIAPLKKLIAPEGYLLSLVLSFLGCPAEFQISGTSATS